MELTKIFISSLDGWEHGMVRGLEMVFGEGVVIEDGWRRRRNHESSRMIHEWEIGEGMVVFVGIRGHSWFPPFY